MDGKNKLVISEAEMKKAIQHYLCTVLFRKDACPEVTSIVQVNHPTAGFEVAVEGN